MDNRQKAEVRKDIPEMCGSNKTSEAASSHPLTDSLSETLSLNLLPVTVANKLRLTNCGNFLAPQIPPIGTLLSCRQGHAVADKGFYRAVNPL